MSASYQQDTETTGTGHFFSILHELNSEKNGFTCYLYKNIFSFRISSLNRLFFLLCITRRREYWWAFSFHFGNKLVFLKFHVCKVKFKWSNERKRRQSRDDVHHKSSVLFPIEYVLMAIELMNFFRWHRWTIAVLSKCLLEKWVTPRFFLIEELRVCLSSARHFLNFIKCKFSPHENAKCSFWLETVSKLMSISCRWNNKYLWIYSSAGIHILTLSRLATKPTCM